MKGVRKLKRISATIGGVFLLTLVVLLPTQLGCVERGLAATGNNVSTLTRIPLTPSEIAAAWPNLPSAESLYDTGGCLMIDLRYSGKQSITANGLPGDGLPDPNSPIVCNMSYWIANYTSNDPIVNLGIIVQNDPHIWLQYNSSIWVEVPASYLQTSVEPYATAIRQLTLNAGLPADQTWAVGEYDNPWDITGSATTTGVISYGEWSQQTLGSNSEYYSGVDVLSILSTDDYWLQNVMQQVQGTLSIVINIWKPNSGSPYINTPFYPWTSTPSLNTMYNLWMMKVGSCWYFY
jgi:hypothetical protein